jgi:hypothetical protein
MPPLNRPQGSGRAAKHDPDVAASDRMARRQAASAAAHAKRPAMDRSQSLARGSGATAKHLGTEGDG